MDRRRFFKTASATCLAGAAIPAASRVVAESVAARSEGTEIRKPLTSYTAEDHRRRLENISICEHGVDGIYNDMGYGRGVVANKLPATEDEVLAFEETDDDDGYLTDMLSLIYDQVNRRGGIVKLHRSGTQHPKTKLKVYDYLWVGEGGRNGDRLREAVKDHPPYVVPCLDMSRATIENENELYLHAIPYMQFPLLSAGRPFTGERAAIPGMTYTLDRKDFWSRHYLAIHEHYKAHPNGPYSYSQWDSAIPRPEARSAHAHWLKQYLPIVEEGTWAWLELGKSSLFAAALPENVVASAFANRELYLVLANYDNTPKEVTTSDTYMSIAGSFGPAGKTWKLPGRSLHILRRRRVA